MLPDASTRSFSTTSAILNFNSRCLKHSLSALEVLDIDAFIRSYRILEQHNAPCAFLSLDPRPPLLLRLLARLLVPGPRRHLARTTAVPVRCGRRAGASEASWRPFLAVSRPSASRSCPRRSRIAAAAVRAVHPLRAPFRVGHDTRTDSSSSSPRSARAHSPAPAPPRLSVFCSRTLRAPHLLPPPPLTSRSCSRCKCSA